LPDEYWLHSGVYAFRIAPFRAVGGMTSIVDELSEDRALRRVFAAAGYRSIISNKLVHELMHDMRFSDWLRQKFRWMGELLLGSRKNVWLLAAAPVISLSSPLLMWRVSGKTGIRFSLKTYAAMPLVTGVYALVMAGEWARIAWQGGVVWSGRLYKR